MNATEYLKHWETLDHDRVLGCQKHQDRLWHCADYVIGNHIIDVGCAFGHSTNIMKNMYPASWVGVDFCSQTIDTAKKTFPDIRFEFCNEIDELDILGKFDSCVCSEVIEHVENDRLLIEKLLEITKSHLIISTPNKKIRDPGHLRVYTPETIEILFSDICDHKLESIGDFFYIKITREV
jgi:2-polyprenyl-3-methyl-5-hydroxy-6-metoxy-1,4-benzoquinol methylase